MKKYRVTREIKIEVVTLVEAELEEEAEKIAMDRETSICIHGSEFSDGLSIDNEDFVLVDGMPYSFPNILDAEEYEE